MLFLSFRGRARGSLIGRYVIHMVGKPWKINNRLSFCLVSSPPRRLPHFLPRHTGEDTGWGEPQGRCWPISDHDHLPGEIIFAAFPLLYPPPYDGGGDQDEWIDLSCPKPAATRSSGPCRTLPT